MTPDRHYPPDWLDDDAAAYLLCLPVSTFREYVACGALPAGVKIGKHRRWSRSDLNVRLASGPDLANTGTVAEALRGIADGTAKKSGRRAA